MGSSAASHIVVKCLTIEAALSAKVGITLPKFLSALLMEWSRSSEEGSIMEWYLETLKYKYCLAGYLPVNDDPINSPT